MLYNLFVILFSLINGKEMMWQSKMENSWIQDTGRGQKKTHRKLELSAIRIKPRKQKPTVNTGG